MVFKIALRSNLEKEMVSKCCQFEVCVQGTVTHYYECQKCGKACDLTNEKLEDSLIDFEPLIALLALA